jgi:hypothetical protein
MIATLRTTTLLASIIVLVATARLASAEGSAGPVTIQILMEPERVEAFRIVLPSRVDRGHPSKQREWIGGYPVIQSAGTSAQMDGAIEIAGSILSANGFSRRCVFQPGYAVRYWRGTRSVSLLFCFHCVEFHGLPPAGGGEPAFGGDFGRVSIAVVKFLRKEFPDDRDLAVMERK